MHLKHKFLSKIRVGYQVFRIIVNKAYSLLFQIETAMWKQNFSRQFLSEKHSSVHRFIPNFLREWITFSTHEFLNVILKLNFGLGYISLMLINLWKGRENILTKIKICIHYYFFRYKIIIFYNFIES